MAEDDASTTPAGPAGSPVLVRFRRWLCRLREGRYGDGRTALSLVDAEDGGPVATVTVAVPGEPLADDEVVVKDHGENAGLLRALVDAGVVEPTGRVVVSGWVRLPVCRMVR